MVEYKAYGAVDLVAIHTQVRFFCSIEELLVMLQETDGLLQIVIGTICAFPEQNHYIAFKDPKNCWFLRRIL